MFFFHRPLPIRASENTQAEVQLVFSESSPMPLPAGDEVVKALQDVAQTNSTLSSLIDPTAITVISKYG